MGGGGKLPQTVFNYFNSVEMIWVLECIEFLFKRTVNGELRLLLNYFNDELTFHGVSVREVVNARISLTSKIMFKKITLSIMIVITSTIW